MLINIYHKNGEIQFADTTKHPSVEEDLIVLDLSNDELDKLFGYKVVNGALQADDNLMNEVMHNRAMSKKAILIPAFGKYRADVVYGLIEEDETTKETLLDWYKRVQEDDIEAIECPPNIIEKYL